MTRVVRLGVFCRVIAGQSPKGSSYNNSGEGIEFHQGKKAFGKDIIEPSGVWTTEITKIAEPGDILMSVRAPVGPTNTTDRRVCIGRGLAAIRCSNKVLPQYVLYCLKSLESKIVGKDGAVFSSINKNMIEDLPIPDLSLTEQQRIVEILDAELGKIDLIINHAEKNLQNAKELFQSVLKSFLSSKKGWKTSSLKGVCTDFGEYGMSVPSKEYDGIRYLRITDITEWGDLNGDLVSADVDTVDEKYLMKNGDILFARTGATIGKTLVFDDSFGVCSYAGYLIRYRPNQKVILPRFLYYVTHSKAYYDWIWSTQKQSTLPNISAKFITVH